MEQLKTALQQPGVNVNACHCVIVQTEAVPQTALQLCVDYQDASRNVLSGAVDMIRVLLEHKANPNLKVIPSHLSYSQTAIQRVRVCCF